MQKKNCTNTNVDNVNMKDADVNKDAKLIFNLILWTENMKFKSDTLKSMAPLCSTQFYFPAFKIKSQSQMLPSIIIKSKLLHALSRK